MSISMPRLLPLAFTLALLPMGTSAQVGRGETVVYLVRNAEKANVTDKDASLSDAGRQRAAALAGAMKDTPLDAVYVTQLKRTAETAAAVMAAKKLSPTVVPVGADVTAHAAAVAKAVMERRGKSVLVVGHSNTISAVVAALGGPKLPDVCDSAYAIMLTLRIPASGAPSLAHATFGRPDTIDKTSCGGLLTR